ncbi:condensation domain-containing protein [Micromonospora sp. WMMD1120]|uniref:condensation domain-containing protein n=1 Tax=Micromonospora sp. WMMD1120 TaxID=3016106 RepID=UPI0024169611|nr:condensation domain-containing protein [Micromonospora sp. WMMD1120]MDG4810899.1 condensation domain-containing protein [Micromonospora sp. WMMD1120]
MSTPTDTGKTLNAVESVMAEIWESVLHVSDVGPDDDFFALGGDSLLAIEIISAAEQRGLPLKLVDLFQRPDLRGSCRNLTADVGGDAAPTAALLDQADREQLPAGVSAAYPMTRLQLGLIYENAASGGALYVDVVSREVLLRLDVEVLRQALDEVVRRHPILRTRFDLDGYSEPLQLVEEQATVELELDDLRGLPDEEVAARRAATMEKLARPFDLDGVPLLRAHAAPTGPERFRLTYAFHHAILDGWSESVLALELIKTYRALLRGERIELASPAPFSEFVRLEREALADEGQRQFFARFREGPPGARRQTRRAAPPVPHKVSLLAPRPVVDALAERSTAWGLPIKSLVVAAYYTAVEAAFGTAQVAGLSMSGRPEQPGADLTLGLFLNHLPVRLTSTGATWRDLARQAFEAERELLPQRRFPYSEVIELLGRRPFDVALNFVNFHNIDELLAEGLIEAEEDWRDSTSVPIRVEGIYAPRAFGLQLDVTVDTVRHPRRRATELAEWMVGALDRLVHHPDERATPIEGDRAR